MAAVGAHGPTLGMAAMAESPEERPVRLFPHGSRPWGRAETIRRAHAAIVTAPRARDIRQDWGQGPVASSDGQRLGVRGRSLLAAFSPRYVGSYDRAVSVDPPRSDSYSVFHPPGMACAERAALSVLDGRLAHATEFPIRPHIGDTHGCTAQVLGLGYLLGVTVMPRLKNLAARRLGKPVGIPAEGRCGSRASPHGDTVCSATVARHLMAEPWEGLVRVAASLPNRVVSAHVVARRLASRASANRVAQALRHLGQRVRPSDLLRSLNDPAMRQPGRTQLNRGEARQDLAQRRFLADQGMLRSGDSSQLMHRASGLSVLANAVLVYNTLRIGHGLERAKAPGQGCTLEAIAPLSPLARRHGRVHGISDFSPAHTHHAQEP